MRGRLPLLATGTALVLLAAVPALAAWGVRGAGTTTAGATALAPATGVAASPVAPTATAVDVSFTAGPNPSGTAVVVERDTTAAGGPGPVVLACTASPCHDTGLTSGVTYTYRVRAALGGWSSATLTATATTTAALDVTSAVLSRSGKAKVSGTTATGGVPVDVAVCRGTVATCTTTTPGYLETVSVTPAAPGAWTTAPTATKLVPGTAYTAQAVQGPAVSAAFPFTP